MVAKYQAEMKANNVHKKYIARVSGKLEGTFLVDKPLFCSNPKHSKHAVAITPEEIKQSKPASTTFTVIWYDEKSDTTLLYCYPLTGRTHQIRVHLQSVGHSIVNDVNYGGRRVGNAWLEKLRDDSVATLGKRRQLAWSTVDDTTLVDDNGMKVVVTAGSHVGGSNAVESKDESKAAEEKAKETEGEKMSGEAKEEEQKSKESEVKKEQTELKVEPAVDEDEDERMFFKFGDGQDQDYTLFNEDRIMEIWLHSYEYTILGKTVTTSFPYWAEPSVLHDL